MSVHDRDRRGIPSFSWPHIIRAAGNHGINRARLRDAASAVSRELLGTARLTPDKGEQRV
jgi:hypothetical protein